MQRVLLSQAIALIDRIFPWVSRSDVDLQNTSYQLNVGNSDSVSVIVNAVGQIPSELITLVGDAYASFAASLSILSHALKMWPSRGPTHIVYPTTPGFPGTHPIVLLRTSLLKCADEAPGKDTPELKFIANKDLRDSLRLDVSTAHAALINGEWKPATVIAGSVVESLLLWALQKKKQVEIDNAVNNLLAAKRLKQNPSNDLLAWNLHQFVEVAHELNVVNESTAQQCLIAKDFRNLIHPGRAERLRTRCSRGTAHSAIAAMEQVIEHLQ